MMLFIEFASIGGFCSIKSLKEVLMVGSCVIKPDTTKKLFNLTDGVGCVRMVVADCCEDRTDCSLHLRKEDEGIDQKRKKPCLIVKKWRRQGVTFFKD